MNRHERRKMKVVMVDPATLVDGPLQHTTLPPMLLARIRRIHDVFHDVFKQSLADWIEGFQRDMHPENEVILWEAMARAFQAYLADKKLSQPARQEVFSLLIQYTSCASVDPRKFKHLTQVDVEDILALYVKGSAELAAETNYAQKALQAEADYQDLAANRR